MSATRKGQESATSAPFRVGRAGSGPVGRAVRLATPDSAGDEPDTDGPQPEGSVLARWAIAARLGDALDGALDVDDLPAILKLSAELDRHLPPLPRAAKARGVTPTDDDRDGGLDAAYAELCSAEVRDTADPES